MWMPWQTPQAPMPCRSGRRSADRFFRFSKPMPKAVRKGEHDLAAKRVFHGCVLFGKSIPA